MGLRQAAAQKAVRKNRAFPTRFSETPFHLRFLLFKTLLVAACRSGKSVVKSLFLSSASGAGRKRGQRSAQRRIKSRDNRGMAWFKRLYRPNARSAAFQRTNRPQPLPPQYHRNCIMQVYFLPWMDTNDANVKHGSGALNARRSGHRFGYFAARTAPSRPARPGVLRDSEGPRPFAHALGVSPHY